MKKLVLIAAMVCCTLAAQAQGWFRQPTPNDTLKSVRVLPDGKVLFQIYAPNASQVAVFGDLPWDRPVKFEKAENGVWKGTCEGLDDGCFRYTFMVDGVRVQDPKAPLSAEQASVFTKGPGYIKDVPHGTMAQRWYFSTTLGEMRRMHVWTPAGYENGSEKLPVLYLIHGGGDNDASWPGVGAAGWILDNLLAEGKMLPMIVVMPNGTIATQDMMGEVPLFGKDMVASIIPYVEANYRVLADQDHRAMAGLSMGGMETIETAFRNPGLFRYVWVLSSSFSPGHQQEYIEEIKLNEIAPALNHNFQDLVFTQGGPADIAFNNCKEALGYLEAAGIRYTYMENVQAGHSWATWRADLIKLAPTLFRPQPHPALQGSTLVSHDSKAEIYANPDLAGGVYSPYPTGQTKPAAPPKGYKPFYLSHIGRHGSRYAIGSHIYDEIRDVFADAAAKGNLAPEGQKVWAAYQELLPRIQYREGKLTLLGQEQHRRIAKQIYLDYPDLFKGKTRAQVLSTASNRVIVSMMCFLDEIRLHDADFTYDVDYGREYYPVLIPESSDNPDFVPRVPFPEETLKAYDSFASECFDEKPFMAGWFKDPDAISMDKESFFFKMATLVWDFPNLDFAVPEALSGIFSVDDLYGLWQIQNYSDYIYTARAPGIDIRRCLEMSVTAKDIIDKFDEDSASGVSMRLRFSHDTALMPLLSYLGVNGMDVQVSDPRQLENYWRNYDIPMGCNLQIVFFKGKKASDPVLIQVLLNGFQATLPLPEAAPGFYKWEDFKAKFNHLEI